MRQKEELWKQVSMGWQKTVKYTYAGGKVERYIFAAVENKGDWPTVLLEIWTEMNGVKSLKRVK